MATENIALFKSKLTPKVDMYKYHNSLYYIDFDTQIMIDT